jgi:hypothetical protein
MAAHFGGSRAAGRGRAKAGAELVAVDTNPLDPI